MQTEFRIGSHKYVCSAVPLIRGRWRASITHTDHSVVPPKETRFEIAVVHQNEDQAVAHAETIATGMARKHIG